MVDVGGVERSGECAEVYEVGVRGCKGVCVKAKGDLVVFWFWKGMGAYERTSFGEPWLG